MEVDGRASLRRTIRTRISAGHRNLTVGLRPSAGLALSLAIADYLADLEAARRDPKTVVESRHSLRILLGVFGDIPVDTLIREHVRGFLGTVRIGRATRYEALRASGPERRRGAGAAVQGPQGG